MADCMNRRRTRSLMVLLCLFLSACVPVVPDTANVGQRRGSAAAVTAPSQHSAARHARACDLFLPAGEVEDETILCGYVRVPWDRSQPEGTTADLAYVILKATGANPQRDPIIHVSGGPGLGVTLRQAMLEFIQRYAPLRADRDIIFYDQRGMGHSLPFFSCPYPDEQQTVAVSEQLTAEWGRSPSKADANNAICQEALTAQGYAPAHISTDTSAADLVDLMDALGYEAYNLYGISYGTRLLMSLLHAFPDQALVRSVVLDSPYPLPEDVVNDFAPIGYLAQQTMFQEVFDLCAADPACDSAFPDLRTQFDDLVRSLASQPLSLPDGEEFTAEDLYRSVFPYNPTVGYVAYQPRLIAELAQGDTTTLIQLRNGELPVAMPIPALGVEHPRSYELVDAYLACQMNLSDESSSTEQEDALANLWDAHPSAIRQFLSQYCLDGSGAPAAELVSQLPQGAFNSVIIRFVPDTIMGLNAELNSKLRCTEQWPFAGDLAQVGARLTEAGTPPFWVEKVVGDMAAQSEGCAGWADALTSPTPSVYGRTPVLILNGQLDANTPPAFGEIAAAQLPQAQLVVVPNAGHSILANYGQCPTEIVQQFLAVPEQPADSLCTAAMHVPFWTP